jgi:hypothetical protein
MDHIESLAPGRLSARLREGLCGHHLLFDDESIHAAFAAPERALSRDDADEVGRALLAICREPLPAARRAVDGLDPSARTSLIRLYFRLLLRAEEERGRRH